jgi:sugar lactone lactonase YvrE
VKRTNITALIAITALTLSPTTAVATTTNTVSHPRVLVHYDLAAGQQPENVVVEPHGDLDVVLATARQVERVTPQGRRTTLATLPAPADGGTHTPILGFPITTGLVRTFDGTLYVGYAAGDAALTGIWRLSPGTAPRRVIPFPANSFPNGLALDGGTLYVADSALGLIWRAPSTTAPPPRGPPATRSRPPAAASPPTASNSTTAPYGRQTPPRAPSSASQ